MRIWFDADNAPHVLIMRPLVDELKRRGHDVHFTARDRASTCELMDLYGLPYTRVAGEYGSGMAGKVAGTLGRALALARAMRGWRADVSFGHGSRALPLASRLLGVPTVTMYDYEWVSPAIFNLCCRTILLPAAIDEARCREAGIRTDRVRRFPGYKEELYLAASAFTPGLATELGLRNDRIRVLVRPPATTAHYHNPEAELILDALLARLATAPEVQLVYLARGRDQMAFLEKHAIPDVVVPQKVYDGPTLVSEMDLVAGGGGTMTREAAILGVPSCSFFRGRMGRVDEALEREGRLVMLRSANDARTRIHLARKPGPVTPPDNRELVASVVEAILAAPRGRFRPAIRDERERTGPGSARSQRTMHVRLKADWDTYLHELRRREIELVFGGCPGGTFNRGLELGAGDGFISGLLGRCVRDLLVTDFYPDILGLPQRPGIRLQVLDAERMGDELDARSFDLVFSSNLLEHLPDLPRALAGIHRVLADDGLAVHVLPSAFWKVCQFGLFYPNVVLSRLDRYGRGHLPRSLRFEAHDGEAPAPARHNNPKVDDGREDWVHRFLLPPVHGAVGGHWRELRRFRRRAWREVFGRAGFAVVAEIAGPAASGYGFGLDLARRSCAARGLVAEHAFVMVKQGHTSSRARFFAR